MLIPARTVSVKEMRRLDDLAIKRYGIPALILMENAGRSAAEEALKMLPVKSARRVAVFCGYGNNGGDGFVCARHLINRDIPVNIYLVGKKKKLSREARLNYQILLKMGGQFESVKSLNALVKIEREIKRCGLIIDGIFGIGLKGRLEPFYQGLFKALNAGNIQILALDIPSGLDADTGRPLGGAVEATKTVAFGLLKKGLGSKQALRFTGKIIIGDISLPRMS